MTLKSLFIFVATCFIITIFALNSVYSPCSKCANRDYSLYTVGYIFNEGQDIRVRLANIDDMKHQVKYIDIYIKYPDNTTRFLYKFNVNRTILPGTYVEFTLKLPKIDRNINATLIGVVNGETTVESNDFEIKHVTMNGNLINTLNMILMALAVSVAIFIAVKYMR